MNWILVEELREVWRERKRGGMEGGKTKRRGTRDGGSKWN